MFLILIIKFFVTKWKLSITSVCYIISSYIYSFYCIRYFMIVKGQKQNTKQINFIVKINRFIISFHCSRIFDSARNSHSTFGLTLPI